MSFDPTLPAPSVGLFVTCLVDFFRPGVGFAAISLLEKAGCRVEVPETQVCCGQPAWNNGAADQARRIARDVVQVFESYDYVVAPSGSCAAMLRAEYPRLFAEDPEYRVRAEELAGRSWELTTFLTDVAGVESLEASWQGQVAFQDSCSGLRDLGVWEQPRSLLRSVSGLTLREMAGTQNCCGFGGTFCVKFPEVSEAMVAAKTRAVADTGAEVLVGCDLGCLLNIAGRARREGRALRVLHIAELLDGTDDPGIGQ